MDNSNAAYVSTGHLPPRDLVVDRVQTAYDLFRDSAQGSLSSVYPALGQVDPNLFGICLVGQNGQVVEIGDVEIEFPIMSIAKSLVFAIVCQEIGAEELRARVGVNSTGQPFNSVAALQQSPDGRTNPMVNSGAISTASLLPGSSREERWERALAAISLFAGRELAVMEEIYASASESNFRNREITSLLLDRGRLYSDPVDALDLYTRICSLGVTARDLATIGATFADGGTNPITGKYAVRPEVCHYTLAVMCTAGLYETSGDWLYEIGLPGKSGIGGGIVTIAPGKGGLGTYGPLLDDAGNSIKGQQVAAYLSQQLGLGLFASRPVGE